MEEGETRGASRSKRKYRKATPKKVNNNATMQLLRLQIYRRKFLRRFTSSQCPVGLFEVEFCSTGASVSFSSSLAGFAALCKLRYGPPSTLKSEEGHGPSLLVAVETDTRSARSCGAHASGLGAESMSTANTRREISLLMNRMTYARKQISRKEKGNGKSKS